MLRFQQTFDQKYKRRTLRLKCPWNQFSPSRFEQGPVFKFFFEKNIVKPLSSLKEYEYFQNLDLDLKYVSLNKFEENKNIKTKIILFFENQFLFLKCVIFEKVKKWKNICLYFKKQIQK